MKTIPLSWLDRRLEMAARPVTRQAFGTYARAVGARMPERLARGGSSTAAVTGVSQVEAQEYCRWLSAQEGRRCRLPALAELHWLAYESAERGDELMAWTPQAHPELPGSTRPAYLCEWTQETEAIAQGGEAAPIQLLSSIFYPTWAWGAGKASHIQARLNASAGYAFVTFRVAYIA